jgi:trk system potassium uptake protein TrkA
MARRHRATEYAVIGLGRFGSSLALTLTELGYTVLGIDRDRELMQRLSDQLAQTIALDSTDENALRQADITSFDTVVVAIGTNFEANLMTTVALKALGVRTVIAKALNERQRAILLKVGADRVILPEYEAGRRLAQELASTGSIDQLDLGPGHSVVEMNAPRPMAGRSLQQIDLRRRFNVTVLVVKRGDALTVSPAGAFVVREGDVLIVVGANDDISRLSEAV